MNNETKFEKVVKEIVKYVVIIIIIFALAEILATLIYKNLKGKIEVESLKGSSKEETIKNISSNMKSLRSVIDKMYIGDIDENKLREEALKGYIKGIGDKYTEYFTKEEWGKLNEVVSGEFYGIGVYLELSKDEKNIVITSVMKDSPAEKAGLKSGDILAKVNEKDIDSEDFENVTKYIKGEKGTKVKVTVYREKEKIEKEIERQEIKVNSTKHKMLENNIGYIHISTFTEHTDKDFEASYKELENQGMKKLIIDVRFNTGGELEATKKVLEQLLKKDSQIIITRDKEGKEEVIKTKKGTNKNIEIVVLGNNYSASASEILISALVDNKVAKFVGEKTYGKGVIQTIVPLSDGGALKVTTEEYLRQNKEKINKIGITPEFEVKLDLKGIEKENPDDKKDNQLQKAIDILNENK
ncbi:MAG: S41 family peptidase [Clostridiales bacterium]|nr:S41 family peptidase [Clostridiales bacterium]